MTDPVGRSLGLKTKDWPGQSISSLPGGADGEEEWGAERKGGELPQECRLLQAAARQPGQREREGVGTFLGARPRGQRGAQQQQQQQREPRGPAPLHGAGRDLGPRPPTAGPGREGTGRARPARRGRGGRGQRGVGRGLDLTWFTFLKGQ